MISPERLRRFPHFAEAPDEILKFIAMNSRDERCRRGDTIFIEGNPAKALLFLEEGEVDIIYRLGDERRIVVDTIVPGETFSWSAALPPHILSATAVASKDCVLFGCDRASLERICEENPVLGMRLMTEIARVLRRRLISARVQLAANGAREIVTA
ncbi:MAG: cyclic nucleotide-binding domain-containing protein [Anaerolineales bacterium]|nr:cyclic nucleotide-binding domain-containing protein [Anaerolineales bacterium]